MKILLTGGLGYIGSHISVCLLNSGFEVIVIDNLSNSSNKVLKKIKSITKKEIIFYEADIRDNNSLREIFRKNEIKSVIHLAGLKSVNESLDFPQKYIDNNVFGSKNLINVMNEFNCKKMIFSSSASVYGESQKAPFEETSPTQPTNPYGETKLEIENYLHDLSKMDKDWEIIALRYFNPLGAHKSGLIGETFSDFSTNIMPLICEVAAQRRDFFYIFGDDFKTPDGTGIRDYVHVMDLAEAHVKSLGIPNNKRFLVLNIGTGKGYSVLELLNTFMEKTGIDIPYKIKSRREGDVDISFADTKKAKLLLQWLPSRNLEDMCTDAWFRYESNLNKH